MSRKLVRVGDQNSAGGKVISGDNTVRVNGKPVAVDGSPVTCHQPTKNANHVHARCRASNRSIRVNGKPLIFVGDIDTCGHKRVQGSGDTGGTNG